MGVQLPQRTTIKKARIHLASGKVVETSADRIFVIPPLGTMVLTMGVDGKPFAVPAQIALIMVYQSGETWSRYYNASLELEEEESAIVQPMMNAGIIS